MRGDFFSSSDFCFSSLINPEWDEPHHIICLNRAMGALQITAGTYHRSISNKEGSIVLNQAIRDEKFNPENEFIPVSLRDRKDLQEAQKKNPVYWAWEKDQIKRIKLDPIQSKKKALSKLYKNLRANLKFNIISTPTKESNII